MDAKLQTAQVAKAAGGNVETQLLELDKNVETPRSGAARATVVGAVIAAFAAASCCVLPAVLAVVGLSGVGAAAALEAHRSIFLGVTAALLGLGFYLVYRKPRALVEGELEVDGCRCPAPRTRRSGKSMLWLGAVAVVFFVAYPYIAGAIAQTDKSGDSALSADSQRVKLHIEGMTCEGCVTHIVTVLTKTSGVVHASVAFAEDSATVTYDPKRVQPEALASAVSALDGYTATLVSREPKAALPVARETVE